MPAWSGKWLGGRYYLDELGRQVFFIERRRKSIRLATHDENLAVGELAAFLRDPAAYVQATKKIAAASAPPVYITEDGINEYLKFIRDTVVDHRNARRSQLLDWADRGHDLRTVTRAQLRTSLATFGGGFGGRVEALNAFSRYLVEEERTLPAWVPLRNDQESDPENARAERVAYSIEQLRECYRRMRSQRTRDVLLLRASTGLHHTEVEQLEGATVQTSPLGDKGVAIRTLGDKQRIRGVIQVLHKSGHRHRQSVGEEALAAALRLVESVPARVSMYKQMDPLIPSNLRHTFITLSGECGEFVNYSGGGVDLDRIAEAVGHRRGSKMTGDRYSKLQVPPMIALPLGIP